MQHRIRVLISIIGVAFGIALIALAIPRTVSAYYLFQVDPTWQDARLDKQISLARLQRLRDGQLAAAAWLASGKVFGALAVTEIALAKADPEFRTAWYRRAAGSTKAGLLSAPANPYAWTRLAYLRLQEGAVHPRSVGYAISMSYVTGPYERRLVCDRIHYALTAWRGLTAADQMMTRRQILWADDLCRRRLVHIGQKDSRFANIIILSLARDFKRLKRFVQTMWKK